MTTRAQAETLLFANRPGGKLLRNVEPKTYTPYTLVLNPPRRRLEATYCPHCRGWVEVRLDPVRLHCTGCGLEATP